ncbi:MAG: hypothetical protein H7X86_03440 [Gorillibacterium sp.]|nr:hypothetical protein [Gorillibacterium sp.]
MEWLSEYEADLEYVFSECKQIVKQFPALLDVQAQVYLNKIDSTDKDRSKNYICYLLPFWLMEETGASFQECQQMSIANIFCMLYFFIQDDVMDSDSAECKRQIPLANLFYSEFLTRYITYFPQGSPFWQYFKCYLAEWADSVSNEAAADYFQSDVRRIAGKSSPLKLSSTGALLLAGKEHLIPAVTDRVERALVALQMADDLTDWAEDLAEGSYNSLLSLARFELKLSKEHKLTYEEVHSFLYDQLGLTRFSEIATELMVEDCTILSTPHLHAYHNSLVESLCSSALQIETQRKRLAQGGLYYWLSKNLEG